MEVTNKNFDEVLPEVLSAVQECIFIAIDTEFTGLRLRRDGTQRASWADLPHERYRKLKEAASPFSLIQVGICFFFKTNESLLTGYSAKPYNFYVFPSTCNKKKDKWFMCQASSLALLASHGINFNTWITEGIPYMTEADARKMCGGEDVDKMLGFTRVIQAIAKSGKPVVGHNLLLDLLHLHTHFIAPLPQELNEFKTGIHERFSSRIYDTKVVLRHKGLEVLSFTDSLPDVYGRIKKPPFPTLSVSLPPSSTHYSSTSSLHEAAYDAYISGYSLLAMAIYQDHMSTDGDGKDDLFQSISLQENKVFLALCDGTYCLHLTGEEPFLPRDHVFLMTVPEQSVTEDIKNLFSPFGGCRVSWLTSTSAHVSMMYPERTKEAYGVITSSGTLGSDRFTLSPYTSSGRSSEAKKRQLEDTGSEGCMPATKRQATGLFDVAAEW